MLDDDSLLQIFSHYRLNDEDNWNLRLTWLNLARVCRRWRFLIYRSSCHLDMSLLLTNDSPSLVTLSHLPPLPLVIDYSDRTRTIAQKDEDNIHLGLQQCGYLRGVVLQAPSSSLHIWLEPMNRYFPRLGDLSLSSTTVEETNLILPETLQAPDLRRLSLHGISLPKGLSLLSFTLTLSSLSLTHIKASCYFPPGQLVTQLQGLLHLEELSVGFTVPIPLPSSERELLPPPIPPVTLPTLRRLTFRGVEVYLENFVAQVDTPLLERLDLTFFFDLTFTLVNLTKFIHRTDGLGCPVAKVVFHEDCASIDAGHYKQRDIGSLSLRVNCEPLDWQIDSATQVCIALGNVLSAVEELTLDLNAGGMAQDRDNTLDSLVWHELLLPFIGVKKLHIGSSITFELSRALESVAEGLVPEFLPELRELEVQLGVNRAKAAFAGFIDTRESVGRPIHLLASRAPSSSRGFLSRLLRGASLGATRGTTRGARGAIRGAGASHGTSRGASSIPRGA
jgi:F-box-like